MTPATVEPANSRAAIAGGAGGAAVLIYIVDRLLADDGHLAAQMFTRLSPVLGPVWASWPMLGLTLMIARAAHDRWAQTQRARAAVAKEAIDKADATASMMMGAVDGVRTEMHSLRTDLLLRLDANDVRLGTIQAEVTQVGRRVDVLERSKRRPR